MLTLKLSGQFQALALLQFTDLDPGSRDQWVGLCLTW
jgi:hypothetical protein